MTRVLVGDSVFEDAELTIFQGWLHIEFTADDLPNLAISLDDLKREGVDVAPVRICCGQRHYGPVCPDGKVMCCLCFERFLPAELSETVDGDKQDVCVRCYELERVAG